MPETTSTTYATTAEIRTTATRISLWVPGTPPTQGSMRAIRGHVLHSNAASLAAWRAKVREAVDRLTPADMQHLPLEGPLELGVMATLRRPKHHYRRNGSVRQTAPVLPVVKPDLDKIIRAVGDALTIAGAWRDDAQVVRVLGVKAYALDPMEVGTEVLIRRAPADLVLPVLLD